MSIRDSIGTAVSLLVDVHDANLKVQLQDALLNAQGEALDLQERMARLQEDNDGLRQQVKAQDKSNEVAEQLYYARHAYWRRDEAICSAYCPACWDTKRQLVRLMRVDNHDGFCNACKSQHLHVYDGPQPNEGEAATPESSTSPPSPMTGPPLRSHGMHGF